MMEFMNKYATEEQCRKQLFESRWPEGFVCPKCGHKEYFNVDSRDLYQCKACRYQASLTAGTIMDKTKTPLRKWFLAIYLMSEDKRGISALSLKSKIGVAYQTAWSMCQKIRQAMSQRDANYKLDGKIELDEAFFASPAEGGKRGRGTDKTAVFVSVSLTDDGKPEFLRMKVVDTDKGEAVNGETAAKYAEKTINKGSEIHTDGLNVYACMANKGYSLVQKKYDPEKDPEHLRWTHIIISNVKAIIGGTFHGLDKIHLQRYLDEITYRFNRRWFKSGIFSRLLTACACSLKVTYDELIG